MIQILIVHFLVNTIISSQSVIAVSHA